MIAFLKTLQRLKQEWQKSPCSLGTRQTNGKNLVWFGEIERKLAKYQIINAYLYLPFFLLIILWYKPNAKNPRFHENQHFRLNSSLRMSLGEK
jgi:hypothetical protein